MTPQSSWRWVPSVYFAQGLPYAVVVNLMLIVYKTLGWSNIDIVWVTSGLYLPWVLKPLWAPALEKMATKRLLLCWMQFIKALVFFLVVLSLGYTARWMGLLCLLMLAISSATYDTVSDGVYLLNLSPKKQAYFVGIRSLAYQLARLFVLGGMVMFFGVFALHHSVERAWQFIFILLGVVTLLLGIYHLWVVPEIEQYKPISWGVCFQTWNSFRAVILEFIKLPHVGWFCVFLLFYNAAEAELMKIVPLFLLDSKANGGLGLSVYQVGWLEGIVGLGAMVLGSFVGGVLLSRFSLRRCIVPFTILMGVSGVGYLFLSWNGTVSFFSILGVLVFDKFAFGLATSAYMLSLMRGVGRVQHPMSLYALGTGLMALGVMLCGALSGNLQHWLGYRTFFEWTLLLSFVIIILSIYLYFFKGFLDESASTGI